MSISGDRIIGTDSASSSVFVSNDAGATWIATPNIASMPPRRRSAMQAFGPIGQRARRAAGRSRIRGGGPRRPGTTRPHVPTCCTARDGVTWNVTDLATVGAPRPTGLSSVTVGADHIDVSYEVAGDEGDPTVRPSRTSSSTLIGTPKAVDDDLVTRVDVSTMHGPPRGGAVW